MEEAYQRALDAYKRNRSTAEKFGRELEAALQMAELASDPSAIALFREKAESALRAQESFMKSADRCVEVMQEIRSGVARDL